LFGAVFFLAIGVGILYLLSMTYRLVDNTSVALTIFAIGMCLLAAFIVVRQWQKKRAFHAEQIKKGQELIKGFRQKLREVKDMYEELQKNPT
jgi:membrane protein implicated in regulation of membrane protease activity